SPAVHGSGSLTQRRDDNLTRAWQTILRSRSEMRSFPEACIAVLILALTCSAPSLAQWERHTSPNVPRTPSGDVDLEAPAPRTADGKPDLTGVWQVAGAPPGGGDAAQQPGAARSGPPVAGFLNIAQNIPEGLPFRPEA